MPCRHPPHRLAPRFGARDYISGESFQICRCGACGLDLTTPPPDPGAMGSYYPVTYYAQSGARRFPTVVEWGQRLLYASRVRTVEALAGGRAGRVLDIGCGPGALLEAFRRRGWDTDGTELSDSSAARARANGLRVHTGPLDSFPWPAGHFDAVVMWHVLEHWADPLPVLAQVRRLLRAGGVFFVGVPNFGSAEARLTRDKWFHLDVPRHLVHFTPPTLTAALQAAGFEVKRCSYSAPEYDCFSFVQSTLNQMGLAHNLLYNLLRGRSAKVLRSGSVLQRAASVALAAPLSLLSLPATAFLGMARQGSSLTVWSVAPSAHG
jgi:SAM-dependent methyltransferase